MRIERTLMVTRADFTNPTRGPSHGNFHLVSVSDTYPETVVSLALNGLPHAEATVLLDTGSRLSDRRFALTIEALQPAAPDLLTQAATKAKAGDVKEAVRLAVEALQKMAEGEK
jgi:hypothetical protein